jgi:pyruvate/2-oxoglutarate dehydrogenase complex dihydrolipoamide dehydrogenase (E3) component
VAGAVAAAGGESCVACSVVGIWRDGGPLVAVLSQGGATPRLRVARTRTVVIASGTTALPPVFPRNDLPGILDGRGAARALAEEGLLPGRRCVVAGGGAEGPPLAERLRARGCEVVEVGAVAAARGGRRLSAVTTERGQRVACDALLWCGPRAAASDLGRLLGVEVVASDAGWALQAGPRGETSVPGVWAAGEVTGPLGVADAAAAGRRCGEAAADHR